jgi:hypothetical protein
MQSNAPRIPVQIMLISAANQKFIPVFIIRSDVIYAPIPKKQTCPRENCPDQPIIRFKLSVRAM